MGMIHLTTMLCLWLPFNLQEQDLDITCFFCHMDCVFEMKAQAAKHWKAGVKCETCHGASVGHLDVEDNSVKPDKTWNSSDVHELCKGCHEIPCAAYGKSAHARKAGNQKVERELPTAPNCSTCHGFHGLRTAAEIREGCLRCHWKLPEKCVINLPRGEGRSARMNCSDCHEPHSLVLHSDPVAPQPRTRIRHWK